MAAAVPLTHPVPVGQLVHRRLRELNRTSHELAEAVRVTEPYIADLVAGRRRAPAPGSDVYAPMAKFLGLHRNDLPACARAERAAESQSGRRPDPAVRRLLFTLCDPGQVKSLTRRLTRADGAELEWVIVTRLLGVAQGFVNRRLQDEAGLRVAAMREGCAFLDVRMRLLEFLDAAPDTVTAADCAEFVCSRISVWQIDVETRTMRIQLRS